MNGGDLNIKTYEGSSFSGSVNTGGNTGGFPGGGFGMGSDDVKLKYIDDDTDSYSNIFNNAKTPVDTADKKRLIRALKALSEETDIETTVDVEEVIRYFVVHNFLCNGDSYTGQMIHNYYLYEKDGQLSMIPWDYNLAYGSFMGGNASSSVNSPIDTPVSGGMSDRPMIAWIFDNEEYTEQYHELFSEFLSGVDFEKLVSDTAELIDKYVEKDSTKFCTYDEFKTGVEAIKKFCTLRAESVSGQLDGTIPSTTDGQTADSSALIDTDGLNTSDMGSMGGGFGGGQKGGFGRSSRTEKSDSSEKTNNSGSKQSFDNSEFSVKMTSSIKLLDNEEDSSSQSKKRQGSGGGEKPGFGGQSPQGFGGEMPEGFDPGKVPGGFSGNGKTEADGDNSSAGKQTTVNDTEVTSAENRQGDAPSQRQDGLRSEGRPQMGDFSPMGGGQQADNKTAYILLGVSALVLLLGLGFAAKFRR